MFLSAVTKNEPNKDLRGFRLQKRGWCVVCFGCLNYVDVFESDVVDTGEKIDRK